MTYGSLVQVYYCPQTDPEMIRNLQAGFSRMVLEYIRVGYVHTRSRSINEKMRYLGLVTLT